MRGRVLLAAVTALAGTSLAACRVGADADPGAAADAASERARSRAAVQEAARTLLGDATAALPARAGERVARWEGCTAAFPEGWATVRWSVEVRLDLAADARASPPYLARLRPVLERAGFGPVGRVPGHPPYAALAGERDGVEASVTHTGAGRFVLVALRGGCVAAGEDLDGVR